MDDTYDEDNMPFHTLDDESYHSYWAIENAKISPSPRRLLLAVLGKKTGRTCQQWR